MSEQELPREQLSDLITQVLKQKQRISMVHDVATDKINQLEDIKERADSVYGGFDEHLKNLNGLLDVLEESVGVLDDADDEGLGSY
tara:strand:- start:1226 stop:1483 length:258 start_codon:yes stop_codon:yes gene_type:complete